MLLSCILAFLVDITLARWVSELSACNCKKPDLILLKDKTVLRPKASFFPKLVSAFHLQENIVLLSCCPAPVHPKEILVRRVHLSSSTRKPMHAHARVCENKVNTRHVLAHGPRCIIVCVSSRALSVLVWVPIGLYTTSSFSYMTWLASKWSLDSCLPVVTLACVSISASCFLIWSLTARLLTTFGLCLCIVPVC